MRRFLLSVFTIINISVVLYAQSWQTGTNKIYVWPDTTNVGVGRAFPYARLHVDKGALKIGYDTTAVMRSQNVLKFGDASFVQIGEWEADDMLSFKANKYNFTKGNVGVGVTNPQYKLDVNGKLFLHTYDSYDGLYSSYLHWAAHRLVMGVPAGRYAYTRVEIMPGGSSQGELCSQLSLYHAYSETDKSENIRLASKGKCWINNYANVGIGTDDPMYKLDVRGTIRATEIIVNTPGADFVFADDYNLRPLQEVKFYIAEKRHLPEIPSAQEMQEEGMSINQMVVKLLQKVEELTLYNIQLEERIRELENKQK